MSNTSISIYESLLQSCVKLDGSCECTSTETTDEKFYLKLCAYLSSRGTLPAPYVSKHLQMYSLIQMNRLQLLDATFLYRSAEAQQSRATRCLHFSIDLLGSKSNIWCMGDNFTFLYFNFQKNQLHKIMTIKVLRSVTVTRNEFQTEIDTPKMHITCQGLYTNTQIGPKKQQQFIKKKLDTDDANNKSLW